jgi:hypothetical protein
VVGIVVEVGFAASLITAWLVTRPHGGLYDNTDPPFMTALLVCLFSGWHLLGGRGCAVGCAVQLLRFGAFVALFVFALSAYNPHMDNGCYGSPGVDACISRAQHDFKWTYAALSGMTVVSALSLVAYASRKGRAE